MQPAKIFCLAVCFVGFGTSLSLAQFSEPGARIVHTGYRTPSPMTVAPGQLVTLFVLGLEVETAAADAFPLPREMVGVSARIRDAVGDYESSLPILSVRPDREDFWTCSDESFGCPMAAVTVQIPTEIAICRGQFGCPADPEIVFVSSFLTLSIMKDGDSVDEMQFVLVDQRVHVLNHCDTGFAEFLSSIVGCMPAVTHADGSLIGGPIPAKPGEVVTLYAVGLTRSVPFAPTGEAAPPEGAVIPGSLVSLAFAFAPDPNPCFSSTEERGGVIEPEYVGLVGGFAGLYQINFRVPEKIPAGTPGCGSYTAGNLRITVFAGNSRDEALFCVAP